MVSYLLQIQGVSRLRDDKEEQPQSGTRDGHWQASCRRAPMQGSRIGDTVLALMGLKHYAAPEQKARAEAARADADLWRAKAPVRDQQD